MNVFSFSSSEKTTNNAKDATYYVKLDKKRRESSKRNYHIISPRVIITAIIINQFCVTLVASLAASLLQAPE